MSPEPSIGGGAGKTNGRRDHTDEHHSGLRRACVTLSRFDALARAGYRTHVDVLWFAFVVIGPELALTHRGGRADIIGWRFASGSQRDAWHKHKSVVVKREEPVRFGAQLIQQATDAFVAFVVAVRPGFSGAHATPQIERLLRSPNKPSTVELSAKSAE